MGIKLNLIVAACQGNGIGNKGTLPWKLKYFTLLIYFLYMCKNKVVYYFYSVISSFFIIIYLYLQSDFYV